MGVIITCTESHLDYFTHNLTVCKGDQVATIHGYVSMQRVPVTADVEEPLGLQEAKQHLNYALTETTHDEEVQRWIKEARQQVEQDTGLALPLQRVILSIAQFPSYRSWLNLPVWPVRSVEAFSYVDRDGAEQNILASPSDFLLSSTERPARLGLTETSNWPTTARKFNPGTLEVMAGWETRNEIPRPLVLAVKKLIGDYANFRESSIAFAGLQVQPVPQSYADLIAPWVLPVVA